MSSKQRILSRRNLLLMGVAAGVAGSLGRALAQPALRRTPDQVMGPFWPTAATPDRSGDLTRVPGRPGRAQGQLLHVMGRVLGGDGKPVVGAKMEVWQANSFGRYDHPSDNNPAPLDPNFEGFGEVLTDANGRYHFETVKPGKYPAGRSVRPPHIHFEITGHVDRLVTQMYFDGEPDNAHDQWLHSTSRPEALIVPLRPPTAEFEPESRLAIFDIVLTTG
jgi:protocatechuate 3,4-dioxygenase, beta subunit